MGVLSNELSSWRKNIVECSAGEVTTLNFRDTRPNVMLVMNPTEYEILCNLDSIPSEKHFDFRIKNHYARLVGKPVATSQVYFLNTSNETVTLQVYSIYDKNFDPSWLSDFSIDNVNLGSESIAPIVKAITENNKVEITEYSGTNKVPVTDTLILEKIDTLMNVSSSPKYRNLTSISDRLELIYGSRPAINNGKSIKDLFNAINEDCAISGSSFGAVLLNNEEPVEGFLGLYNIIQEFNTIATKLDTIATKLDTLIAK